MSISANRSYPRSQDAFPRQEALMGVLHRRCYLHWAANLADAA